MAKKAIETWKNRTAKGKDIFLSSRVKSIHPVMDKIVNQLIDIDLIQYVRITENDVQASNEIAIRGRTKIPVSTPGHPTAIGIHLIIDESDKVIQVFEITSAKKGYGNRIVGTVMASIPDDWDVIIIMDYSNGFWDKMSKKYDNIIIP